MNLKKSFLAIVWLIFLGECVHSFQSPASAEAALAFGQYGNGGWAAGSAYNAASRAEAMSTAMRNCNARGFNCSIRVTFHDSCLAYAVQDSGNGWRSATNSNRDAAWTDALTGCAQMGLSCTLREAFCDNVSEERLRFEAAQRAEQTKRNYEAFLQQWQACFGQSVLLTELNVRIAKCDQAVTYSNVSNSDQARLLAQRQSLYTARNRANEEEQQRYREAQQRRQHVAEEARESFLQQWQACFGQSALVTDLSLRISNVIKP
jgi:hypothetical protein